MSMYAHELPPQDAPAEGSDEVLEGLIQSRHYALRSLQEAGAWLKSLESYAKHAEREDIELGGANALRYLDDVITTIESTPEA